MGTQGKEVGREVSDDDWNEGDISGDDLSTEAQSSGARSARMSETPESPSRETEPCVILRTSRTANVDSDSEALNAAELTSTSRLRFFLALSAQTLLWTSATRWQT